VIDLNQKVLLISHLRVHVVMEWEGFNRAKHYPVDFESYHFFRPGLISLILVVIKTHLVVYKNQQIELRKVLLL